MSKLDQILADRIWFIEQEITSGQNVKDVLHNSKDELEDKIKKLFQELINEVIGINTITHRNGMLGYTNEDMNKNALRQEQRQRAKELLEEL